MLGEPFIRVDHEVKTIDELYMAEVHHQLSTMIVISSSVKMVKQDFVPLGHGKVKHENAPYLQAQYLHLLIWVSIVLHMDPKSCSDLSLTSP